MVPPLGPLFGEVVVSETSFEESDGDPELAGVGVEAFFVIE
ncbi:MAG: hypothetical protein AB1486_13595 [Planctomycetota bacterium]